MHANQIKSNKSSNKQTNKQKQIHNLQAETAARLATVRHDPPALFHKKKKNFF